MIIYNEELFAFLVFTKTELIFIFSIRFKGSLSNMLFISKTLTIFQGFKFLLIKLKILICSAFYTVYCYIKLLCKTDLNISGFFFINNTEHIFNNTITGCTRYDQTVLWLKLHLPRDKWTLDEISLFFWIHFMIFNTHIPMNPPFVEAPMKLIWNEVVMFSLL